MTRDLFLSSHNAAFSLLLAPVQQRDPIQTAKLLASLDQVSNGRFLFGVNGGGKQDEMEDHGAVFETRFELMRERIEAMKEIWTKSRLSITATWSIFPR